MHIKKGRKMGHKEKKITNLESYGFCKMPMYLSLKFKSAFSIPCFTVNSTISVQCFNPGVTIVPSQPYTTDTPTASTTVSAVTNTFSFLSTTNIDTSTAGVDKETTTPVKTSSTGKEDVTSVKKVIYTADFNGTVTLNLLITILSSFHE